MILNDRVYILSRAADEKFALVVDALERPDGSGADPFRETASQLYIHRRDRRPMGDCAMVVGGYRVLSDKARELIIAENCDPSVNWILVLPAIGSYPLDEKYWLMSADQSPRILDLKRARYDRLPGTSKVLFVHDWVVKSELVPPYDLFYAEHEWMISSKLKDKITDAALTNFKFKEVKLSRDE